MRSVFATALLLAAGVASAQEGYPLDGTWRGERQAAGGTAVTIVIVMQWDGKTISGIINPGPKSIPLQRANLDPANWTVTLNATDPAGQPISFEGVIADLGEYHRSVSGTWIEGGRKYPVRFVLE